MVGLRRSQRAPHRLRGYVGGPAVETQARDSSEAPAADFVAKANRRSSFECATDQLLIGRKGVDSAVSRKVQPTARWQVDGGNGLALVALSGVPLGRAHAHAAQPRFAETSRPCRPSVRFLSNHLFAPPLRVLGL